MTQKKIVKKLPPLHYKFLRKTLNASQLKFETTNSIKTPTDFVGQERAYAALIFGIGMRGHGYNLYAMGPVGIGKRKFINIVLSKQAKKSPTPSDWCYIYNFITPEKPIAISLPAGRGILFKKDMTTTMDEIAVNVLTVFESIEYRAGLKKINNFFAKKRTNIINNNKKSKIIKTPKWYKKQHEEEKEFQLSSISKVVTPIINKLKKKYKNFTEIIQYLEAVQNDIINNANDILKQNIKNNILTFSTKIKSLIKYQVNLFVDNSQLKGAPIYFENDPSYSTLICRVEHINQQGLFTTNFTLVKAGTLHLANGGYLMIEARKLKKNREVWEALKNALYTRKILIKPIEHDSDSAKPVSLEPMSIPLNVKIILLGDRNTYYSLCQRDPDFTELFKVPVDFDDQIDRNDNNIQLFSKLIATIVRQKALRPFHSTAVAALIDQSSRLAEDIEKLSTHIRYIEDLILESDYWARYHHKKIVKAADVKCALDAQIYRMDRARELYHEEIYRDFIIINIAGKFIGQINALSVRRVGDFSYGHPTRITARVRVGKGRLIDIQREIKMAGPLHTKAGLIISNFLASYFNQNQPFYLYASLAFEQVYCWTDGDSASVAELCVILSALAEVPIYQNLAVTGSIDQYGNVQAVGGVNEKIEGFFDVCKSKGLTGKQGVLIPAINIKNLMLREDIVAAAKSGKFFIYPIKTIDQAISLLTGWEAGKKNKQGTFSKNTFYYRIESRLQAFQRLLIKK